MCLEVAFLVCQQVAFYLNEYKSLVEQLIWIYSKEKLLQMVNFPSFYSMGQQMLSSISTGAKIDTAGLEREF